MRLTARNLVALRVIASFLALLAPAAITQSIKPWEFPPTLRPTLDARLRLFTRAQAEGRWDEVGQLLGRYRRTQGGKLAYTPIHKACFISQMKSSPMTAFEFTVQESPFSSEILSTPLSSKWWTLTGEGVFGPGPEILKRRTWVVAYRDHGDWYFTPEAFDDDAWARQRLTSEDLVRDRGNDVNVVVAPRSPLEFADLHVFIDLDDMASRKISFRLRNRTKKLVRGYSFAISSDRHDGEISVGTGAPENAIEPMGFSRKWEENYSVYTYWCEGESRMSIELQDVEFADGTSWKP